MILSFSTNVVAQCEANLEESIKHAEELGPTFQGYRVAADGLLLRVAGDHYSGADKVDLKMKTLELGGKLQCEAKGDEA